jgi:hypothetical protein
METLYKSIPQFLDASDSALLESFQLRNADARFADGLGQFEATR